MNRIDTAIEFAAAAHRKQVRKGSDIPYISHPYGVAMILQQAKCKEEVIIAALLHDTLEDTDTTEEDIRSRFGSEVLRLVQGASEPDKSASWEERKQHTLDFLKSADLTLRQLSCADKLHNLRSIRRDIEAHGDAVWLRFNRGYEQQKWHYTSLIESLGYASRFPLLDTFQDEVERFFLQLELPQEIRSVRRDKKLYDSVFQNLYSELDRTESPVQHPVSLEDWKLAVYGWSRGYREGQGDVFEQKLELLQYFSFRGIDFEINSEGTDMILSVCAALKERFHLYPHEIYHHLYRNVKKGVL
ncbi:HD domain-containing protein [Paenibacillus cellulositrophicus]|uniref:HD domain-containing protein n=1 Tax=Paenibacillus cellulositrophicus TaxID=562959 RepID=UPI00203B2CD9|nr:HD domain-containing protein [Paenibacillus cellulositrophicus]MCM3001286.1 HD domain-containing protein [Paenibacillus cellulositrophicus]